MAYNNNQAKKALVALAIERVLFKMGMRIYDEVNSRLYENYSCYIPDCYENPEYLKSILSDLYGNSSTIIVQSIKKELEEFEEQNGINNFVMVISG